MTFDDFRASHRMASQWNRFSMALVFVATDLLAVLLSFGTGFFIVNAYDIEIINFKSFVTYWPYLFAFLAVFYILKLYPGISLAHAEELRRFTIASFFSHAGIILSRMIMSRYFGLDAYAFAFMISWVASIVLFPLGRGLLRSLCKQAPWWGVPVVIFGAGKTGRMLADRLIKKPWIGFIPVLFLDDDASVGADYLGIPILHDTSLGSRAASECGIDTAIVAMPGVERARLGVIVADYVQSFRHYMLLPDFFGVTNIWMSVRDLDGMLGLYTSQSLMLPLNRRIKRALDVILSLTGGILISPLLLIIAILIKIDSPGRLFYGQHRLGVRGRPFTAWKFRSMVSNSKEVLDKLLTENPEARREWEENHKLRNDPRVTRVGAFLRKHSLDELPQIWNVLLGEMSLIGPRPIVEDEVEKYGHEYRLFSSVKPGMSGLWQVSGRSETDYEERVALDILYIQSWSLWLDLHILFKTVSVVFGGKGAY